MMRELWFYDLLTKLGIGNYRVKILLMAFIGTHIPLIALAVYFALQTAPDWRVFVATVGVTLAATLIGTGITLVVLNSLLRPVLLTSRTLRNYRLRRELGALPTDYVDEAGTLMADAAATLQHLESALIELEYVDVTTRLPNRRKLLADLAGREVTALPLAACAIRFGQHTRLAETLDLQQAEQAALTIANRLLDDLPGGSLYRAGGADFVLLIEPSADAPIEAAVLALLGACGGTLQAGGLAIEPMLHAGIAMWPDDATAPEALIDHALAAAALATDPSPVRFHSAAARQAAISRLQLEAELRRALARDEFVLHYQPVVDLVRGRPTGAEALIRWQHPERGLLSPGHFVAAAEATGLIDQIGLWVVRQACEQIRVWSDAGLGGMKVAVNLSARQFLDRNLVAYLDEAVRAAGIRPDALEIELTETAAMVDHAHTRATFGKIRDLGVSIAIDDFGTGFASMSYLRKLPFDKLKIDREFVTNVNTTRDSQAICAALISLARGLGLKILAEGTETADEVAHLWSSGCELYQGFYFSRPVAAAEFPAGVRAASLASQPFSRPDAMPALLGAA